MIDIATWNVQRITMTVHIRRRLRSVCERIQNEEWKVVLLSELKADDSGMVWMGEDERECVMIHTKKVGVVLCGRTLRRERENGQKRWFGERVVAAAVGGMHLVADYQPIWGLDEERMERYRRNLERQVAIKTNARLVIGGHFNASGVNVERQEMCGIFNLGRTNDAGKDLFE